MTQCKFRCDHITESKDYYSYTLNAVYGSEENKQYWTATPAGTFTATINKNLGKLFEVGSDYLININEAA